MLLLFVSLMVHDIVITIFTQIKEPTDDTIVSTVGSNMCTQITLDAGILLVLLTYKSKK